jgi:hypothetical protein
MNRPQPTRIPGAFREVVVTPLKWQLPPADLVAPYVAILLDCFRGDLAEFTLGQTRVAVKLYVFAEVSVENVAARAQAAQRRLFAQWQRDSREEALDEDSLEKFRGEFLKRQGIEAMT